MLDQHAPPILTGAGLLLEVLRSEGVTHLFGNPGSTELPLMDALATTDDIEYVLALQEASVTAMAEGYATVTRRPAFVNLHTAAGLGNAIGSLTNARANRAPLVVTAGQQHRGHLADDPLLSGDLVGIARPVTKWAAEVTQAHDLGVLLRRAFTDASTAPAGPVFLSLPCDLLAEPGFAPPPRKTEVIRSTVPDDLERIAQLLGGVAPGSLAIVAGDDVLHFAAVDELVRLAEVLGAPVYAASMHATAVFPQAHPLFADTFTPTKAGIARALEPYRIVLLVGSHALLANNYTDATALPPGVDIIQITPDPHSLARYHAPRLAVLGDPRVTIQRLASLLHDTVDPERVELEVCNRSRDRLAFLQKMEEKAFGRYNARPSSPRAIAHAIVRGTPPDVPIVDEAITAGYFVRRYIRDWNPNKYFFNRGGGLGWGMPFAVGVSLGLDSAPVVCAVGDGSTMYSPQALWTAAHLRLPVVFVVFNNRQYRILKDNLRNSNSGTAANCKFIGMDIDRPAVNFVGLSQALGVPAVRVEGPADVGAAVASMVSKGGPALIEAPVGDGE